MTDRRPPLRLVKGGGRRPPPPPPASKLGIAIPVVVAAVFVAWIVIVFLFGF